MFKYILVTMVLLLPLVATASPDGENLSIENCGGSLVEYENIFSDLTKDKYNADKYTLLKDKIYLKSSNCFNFIGYHILYSNIYMALMDNDTALRFARRAVEIDSENPLANNQLGSLLIIKYNFDEGLSYLEKAINIQPDNIEFLYNYCSSLELAKKYEESIKICTKVIESRKYVGNAYYVRARAYKGLGMLEKSKSDFETAKEFGVDLSYFYSDKHLDKAQ